MHSATSEIFSLEGSFAVAPVPARLFASSPPPCAHSSPSACCLQLFPLPRVCPPPLRLLSPPLSSPSTTVAAVSSVLPAVVRGAHAFPFRFSFSTGSFVILCVHLPAGLTVGASGQVVVSAQAPANIHPTTCLSTRLCDNFARVAARVHR